MKIEAGTLLGLLRRRHPIEKWLTVEECKCGSSWSSGICPRLDMWVMARSWARPRFIGYEIKTHRQDFIRDNKWLEYLKYCREFYFVCPPNIIEPAELPDEAGLLVSSKNGKLLYIKKKAPQRSTEIPRSLLFYVLMSRTQIVGDMYHTRPKIEMWREYLTQMKKNKKLGHEISFLISDRVDAKVKEIKKENNSLRLENERLKNVRHWLEENGLKLEDVTSSFGGIKRRALEEITTGLPFNLLAFLKESSSGIKKAVAAIEEYQEKNSNANPNP